MENGDILLHQAWETLTQTSRTFVIPISRLEGNLKFTVMAAYLCMRSIDEIEDHPSLSNEDKSYLLSAIGDLIVKENVTLSPLFNSFVNILPEVTLRIDDWLSIIPSEISLCVRSYISKMAAGMSTWVEKNWCVETEEDLDDYTYVVAGLVGELLTTLWQWHDGIETDLKLAISFGRGLQAVNIIRNKNEDKNRGVSFFPTNWTQDNMIEYAKKQLEQANQYTLSIKPKHIQEFCLIPLALANATLHAIENNHEKLKRDEVIQIVETIVN